MSASRFACDRCRNLCAAGTRFSVVAARLAASTSATLVFVLVLERAEVVLPHILGLLARDGVRQLNAVARRFPGTKAWSRAPLVVQLQPPPVHRRHSSCRQPPTADSPLLSLIRALFSRISWASLIVMVSTNSMPWLAASQGQKLCQELRWLYSSNRPPFIDAT